MANEPSMTQYVNKGCEDIHFLEVPASLVIFAISNYTSFALGSYFQISWKNCFKLIL